MLEWLLHIFEFVDSYNWIKNEWTYFVGISWKAQVSEAGLHLLAKTLPEAACLATEVTFAKAIKKLPYFYIDLYSFSI